MFRKGDALNQHLMWTDLILKAVPMVSTAPMRIMAWLRIWTTRISFRSRQ